jgi:hypothetical protein
MALHGQRIFDTGRYFRESLAQDHTLLLQGAQAFGKRLGANAVQGTLKLIKTFDTGGQIADNE